MQHDQRRLLIHAQQLPQQPLEAAPAPRAEQGAITLGRGMSALTNRLLAHVDSLLGNLQVRDSLHVFRLCHLSKQL